MDESDSESDSLPVSHAADGKMEDEGELKYPVEYLRQRD